MSGFKSQAGNQGIVSVLSYMPAAYALFDREGVNVGVELGLESEYCLNFCLCCHRKGYHLLALGLFLPALLWEPQLLSISLAIAFALLVVLEIMRLGGVPYVGMPPPPTLLFLLDPFDGFPACLT